MADADSPFSAAGLVARLNTRAPDHGAVSGDFLPADAADIMPTEWKAAAVLIPVIDRGRNASVLFTVRSAGLPNHSSQISFPGGRVEQDDRTPEHTALREAYEEIALEPQKVNLVGTMPVYYTGTGYSVKPVIGIVPAGLSFKVNTDEVQSIFDVPLSFLMNPANHRRCSRIVNGRKHSFYAIGYKGHFIWGATAGIIRIVYERLYG